MKTENETTGEVKVIEKTHVFVQLVQGPYAFTVKTNRLHKANFYCTKCFKFGVFTEALCTKIPDEDGNKMLDNYIIEHLANKTKNVCRITLIDVKVKECLLEMDFNGWNNPTVSILEIYYDAREKFCGKFEADEKLIFLWVN